ncbi:MAG: two-component regulator propeller domain-containing protein, partial [Ignavibacteriales bacterium]
KQIVPLIIFMFIFVAQNPAQINNQWVNYTGDNNIVGSLALEDSILWAGTYGELVKINLNTGKKEFFNASNSGLSVNFIRSIFIDHNKNKWFATYDGGLIKYDGSNWTIFHKGNSGLPDNSIHSVTEDMKGNIWIATYYGGVAKYDGTSFQVFTEKEIGDPMDELERISFDKSNTLWGLRAGAYPGILFKYDGSAWTVFDTRKLQTHFGSFKALATDTSNVVWLATDWGLVSFDGNGWKLHSRPGFENVKDPLTTVFIDKKNNIWTSSEHAIYTYDHNSWTVYDSTSFTNNSGYIWHILANNDKIYVADWGNGLSIYDGKTWTKYDLTDTKFPTHFAWPIATDKNNNTWVEAGSNLVKFDGLNFSIISEESLGLKDYGIYEINFDSHNNMWLTLYASKKSALGRYDGNSLQIFIKDSSASNPSFHKVVIDKNDEIWASSVSGLVKFNGNWITFNKSNSGLPADDIWGIAVDSKNNKWIATGSGGLAKYDGSNWTVFNTSNSQIGSNELYNVAVDNNDDIWVGSSKGLIQLHNPEGSPEWKLMKPYQKDLFNYFRNMRFGINNELYIADYGITKLSGNTYTRYDIFNSGIPNNNIQAFTIDRNNNKWIGTEGGITIFNENGITTDVNDLARKTGPDNYILAQNYPNPFNPSTTINYSIPKVSFVNLKVFDILGREVSTLVSKEQNAGEYKVQFDASSLPSGIYIYSIQAGEFRNSKKLLLIK